ncbi:DUF2264 domain-containing protein [Rhodocytophaga rosea]|uniref:DUF2264 domain-containing protein n=1 Tax=Rhodocytophaga rosea TaxID=2704465 RepID=A0A6C0GG12_9BACT|nr:DUF2264 domain-containing protein [Rhodocytophaga rosea]QHT66723.1 DUF2264 domain-containing protein [Rhodocytophaga rosea]
MIRRSFLQALSLSSLASFSDNKIPLLKQENDREYWLSVLTKLANPVLESLSKGQLKAKMPVEAKPGQEQSRREVTYLEAFGRLLVGMAPWLELGPDDSKEGKLRQQYISLAQQSMVQAVNPGSADYMNFTKGGQPLVDAAFLAHALLRAPTQLWSKLDNSTQQDLINALQSTRVIKPGYNNWLLFSAMVEAALLKFSGKWDAMRVDYAIRQHMAWYKGDGMYGDGPDFHFDYYNSYVIQPMLLDILATMEENGQGNKEIYALVFKRAQRYAAIQERLISPEGTFPPTGRSLTYRFGAFQLLAQVALMKALPTEITPAQVRSALTAVIRKCIEAPGTFDQQGWLRIGLYGSQPGIGEGYISTGSLYLCTAGMLPLGLKPDDEFWASPAADWTAKKVWKGVDVQADKALY